MIINVGAVMYVCVTDVVARMLVIYSCSPAHRAWKRLEWFLMCLLQLSGSLSQPYLLTLPLVWLGNIQKSQLLLWLRFRLPCIKARATLFERVAQRSQRTKRRERERMRIDSWVFFPASCHLCHSGIKPERMIRTALWYHLTILHQSKTRKQSKMKHQPQRCHAAHAVLAELFTSIHVSVFQNHLYKGSIVSFFSTHTILYAP